MSSHKFIETSSEVPFENCKIGKFGTLYELCSVVTVRVSLVVDSSLFVKILTAKNASINMRRKSIIFFMFFSGLRI
jgi:hypothetical protein